jgi:CubicO group peptidase (beta-lactamase class C family)
MISLNRLAVLIAATLLAFQSSTAEKVESDPAQLAEQIGAHLEAYHELDQFNGAALVAENGEVIYRGALGLANADWQLANTMDTTFRLASVSKQFTAMLTLLLVEDGELELDAPITRYLPDYPAESGDRVTIHHLLNHTSGIPSYTDRPGFMARGAKNAMSVEDFVATYCSDPLDFEPGTEFRYNNSGYFLLGAIAEAVTGRSYRAALRERIFEPLKMADTGYDDQYAVLPKRATGYTDTLGRRTVARWMDMSTPFAAGALYSTAGDMWKWDQALRAKTLLDGELEALMFTPGLQNYGYGWTIDLAETDDPWIHHTGGMPGVSTVIMRVPTRGRCVILLCNTGNSVVYPAAVGILDILDGKPPLKPVRRGDQALARKILDEGIDAGLEHFAGFSQEIRERLIEPDFNNLGYQLLAQERIDEAILLFEFNTRAYPEVANTWDSLGEAQAQAGLTESAIESYRKALELDPESTTAPPMIEELEQRVGATSR